MLRTARRSTPGRRVEAALVEDALTEAVHEVAAGEPVAGVGIAAAGFVDAAGERVRFAPHLPWRDEDVRARLAERWGTVVGARQRRQLRGPRRVPLRRGPRRLGRAGARRWAPGSGARWCWAARSHRGRNGMAGEFGHMQVVPDGRPCECGGSGCWEQYCSGNALVRFARERIGREPSVLEELCDGDPLRLEGAMVTAAAEDGDLVARGAFASVGDWLGVGVANLVAALRPRARRGRWRRLGRGRPAAGAGPGGARALAGRRRAPRGPGAGAGAARAPGRGGRRGRPGPLAGLPGLGGLSRAGTPAPARARAARGTARRR